MTPVSARTPAGKCGAQARERRPRAGTTAKHSGGGSPQEASGSTPGQQDLGFKRFRGRGGASANRAGAPPGNRGSVFLPFRRAIPALSGRKPAETGRDTPRRHDNRGVGGVWSTRLPARRGPEMRVVLFLASCDELRIAGVVRKVIRELWRCGLSPYESVTYP